MKRAGNRPGGRDYGVAPHAGAWIETRDAAAVGGMDAVAPHAGAWIETRRRAMPLTGRAGRPPRGGVD